MGLAVPSSPLLSAAPARGSAPGAFGGGVHFEVTGDRASVLGPLADARGHGHAVGDHPGEMEPSAPMAVGHGDHLGRCVGRDLEFDRRSDHGDQERAQGLVCASGQVVHPSCCRGPGRLMARRNADSGDLRSPRLPNIATMKRKPATGIPFHVHPTGPLGKNISCCRNVPGAFLPAGGPRPEGPAHPTGKPLLWYSSASRLQKPSPAGIAGAGAGPSQPGP